MNVEMCTKRSIHECLSIWMDASASPGRSKRLRHRVQIRLIHFADESSTTATLCSKPPLRTTYHVENWMNLVEKEELWVPPHETLQNVISIRARGTLYQQQFPVATSYREYSEALQSSFLQCCSDTQDGSEQYLIH